MYLFWSELYHVRKIVFTVSRITDKQVFPKENLTFHRMTIKLERTKKFDLHTFFTCPSFMILFEAVIIRK